MLDETAPTSTSDPSQSHDSDRGTRQSRHECNGNEPSDSSSSSSESSRPRSRHYRRSQRRRRRSRRRHRSPPPLPRLKPEHVGSFDPAKGYVVSFTKRLQQLARSYSERDVLHVLPLCLKGEAQQWYTYLSDDVTADMERSLAIATRNLERRFKKNVFEARYEADRLKFRFAKEKELPLREYVEKKIMLLQEANITSQTELTRRIWENLDAILMNSVDPDGNSLDEFTERLYQKEIPARLAWLQQTRIASRSSTSNGSSKKHLDKTSSPVAKDTPGSKATDPNTPKNTESTRPRPSRRVRDCRHCGGPHFDFDCPTRRPAVRAYFVDADSPSDDDISEEDKDILRSLRASLDRSSESSNDSKN